MVGALVKTGVIDDWRAGQPATGGNACCDDADPGRLGSGVGIVNNFPYVATMTRSSPIWPPAMPATSHADVLWWALALGADLGGNLTAVGASANVVMLGIARRAGNPISFWEFTRKGVLVTAMSIALAAIYLWLRYFIAG